MKNVVLFISGIIIVMLVYLAVRTGMQQHDGMSGTMLVAPSSVSYAESGGGMAAYGMTTGNAKLAIYPAEPPSYDDGAIAMPVPAPSQGAPGSLSQIVKSGALSLLVRNIEESARAIDAIRTKYEGRAGNANFSDNAQRQRYGSVVIWVPAEHFDAAMTDLKALALRVDNERITADDVSAQVIDLDARLKNLRATEAQYAEILKRSGSITDVLAVTRELTATRSSIEQLEGQRAYLAREVALSSIAIDLTEEANVAGGNAAWRPITVAKEALKDTFSELTGVLDLLIVFLIKLPVLLLWLGFWALLVVGLWFLAKTLYRKGRKLTGMS